MKYACEGTLFEYLRENSRILKWRNKIQMLDDIIYGIKRIHEQGIMHHDLHSGNILYHGGKPLIADLGLSISASTSNEERFGNLPYVAPEVLRNEPYTKASDIYSFGVLMSVMSTCKEPFNGIRRDCLGLRICEGSRPEFARNTPKSYIELANKCMNADPGKRPTAKKIHGILELWSKSFGNGLCDFLMKGKYSEEQIDEIRSIGKEFDEVGEMDSTETICSDDPRTSSLNEEVKRISDGNY